MVSTREGVCLVEIHDQMPRSGTFESKCHGNNGENYRLSSTPEKGLLSDVNPGISAQVNVTIIPGRLNMLKMASNGNLISPSANFRELAEERDETLYSIPSSTRKGFGGRCKEWIKNPLNMVFLLWISCVAVSAANIILVLTGMFDGFLLKESERDAWFEVNNQIFNALFTLFCLYQHPKRFHHLVLLFRWKPKDVRTLRKEYCKNGTYRPRERAHMIVVVVLLHVNSLAQYALCVFTLGYKPTERPPIALGICICVAIATGAGAGIYSTFSPLWKESSSQVIPEDNDQILQNGAAHTINRSLSSEKRFSFASTSAPVWRGGLFAICDDIVVAYLSVFCSFCVLGWNMERLGLGNMYVHIATFLLFCTAPFWIFNLAAIHIDNQIVKEAFGLTGIMLCIFGLLYGGFWRIQMRKRFNLPAHNSCCGKPDIADCAQWLFCCWCSLAQEVRTANYYDTVECKFCKRQTNGNGQLNLSPFAREGGSVQFRSSSTSFILENPGVSRFGTENSPRLDGQLPKLKDEQASKDDNYFLKPPVGPSMQRDGNTNKKL